MTEFVLVNLPELNDNGGGNTKRVYIEFAKFLKAHPGRWGRWPTPTVTRTRSANTAAMIRRGHYPAFRDGFEAASREGAVYVRFTGEMTASSHERRIQEIVREEVRAAMADLLKTIGGAA